MDKGRGLEKEEVKETWKYTEEKRRKREKDKTRKRKEM